ncbi:6-bladed beta-propeller [Gemmatimonadota bacterium]
MRIKEFSVKGSNLAVVMAVASVLGCEGPSPDSLPPGFTVRDSAGVRVMENLEPAWSDGEGWRIGDLLTSVGELEGDPSLLLYRVSDGTRLSDGRVVVANSGTSELRFFDAEGRFLRSVGRVGGGPGEFQSDNTIRALVRLPGDTLLTWDIYGQNLSLFDPEGEFVRATRLAFSGRMYFWRGIFPDRNLLMALRNPDAPTLTGAGVFPRLVRLVNISSEGDSLGVYMDYDEGAWHYKTSGDHARMLEPPLHRVSTLKVGGDRVYLASGESNEYVVLGRDQAPILISRRLIPPDPVTEEDRARHLVDVLEGAPENAQPLIRRDLADIPLPDFLPPYRRMMVDSEQNVWLEDYSISPGAPNSWAVFDSSGRWLGGVTLPEGLDPYEIGPDYLLGEVEDEMDVERVVVYALVKGVSGGRP